MTKNSKIVLIVIAVTIASPIGMIAIFSGQCKVRQLIVKNQVKDNISIIRETKIITTDTSGTNVQTGGDCIDSLPYIVVTRDIPTNSDAKTLINDIRQTLSSQNYTLSEGFTQRVSKTKEICNYGYSATATKNSVRLQISFNTVSASTEPDCTLGYLFRDQPAKENLLYNEKVQSINVTSPSYGER